MSIETTLAKSRGELKSIALRGKGGSTGARRIEQSELDAYIDRNRVAS